MASATMCSAWVPSPPGLWSPNWTQGACNMPGRGAAASPPHGREVSGLPACLLGWAQPREMKGGRISKEAELSACLPTSSLVGTPASGSAHLGTWGVDCPGADEGGRRGIQQPGESTFIPPGPITVYHLPPPFIGLSNTRNACVGL